MELEIEITGELPTNAVYVTAADGQIRVRVSPRVEPQVLSALRGDIGNAVADAVDALPR